MRGRSPLPQQSRAELEGICLGHWEILAVVVEVALQDELLPGAK